MHIADVPLRRQPQDLVELARAQRFLSPAPGFATHAGHATKDRPRASSVGRATGRAGLRNSDSARTLKVEEICRTIESSNEVVQNIAPNKSYGILVTNDPAREEGEPLECQVCDIDRAVRCLVVRCRGSHNIDMYKVLAFARRGCSPRALGF